MTQADQHAAFDELLDWLFNSNGKTRSVDIIVSKGQILVNLWIKSQDAQNSKYAGSGIAYMEPAKAIRRAITDANTNRQE